MEFKTIALPLVLTLAGITGCASDVEDGEEVGETAVALTAGSCSAFADAFEPEAPSAFRRGGTGYARIVNGNVQVRFTNNVGGTQVRNNTVSTERLPSGQVRTIASPDNIVEGVWTTIHRFTPGPGRSVAVQLIFDIPNVADPKCTINLS